MIIMINGAFGVGKTTTANALLDELPESFLFDPEMVGFMLREMIPDDLKEKEAPSGDFQDLVLWRELVVKTAASIVQTYSCNLIVPMTIHNEKNLTYIKDGFSSIAPTKHFCLTASRETIHNRLTERGEQPGSWPFQQTEKCLEAYQKDAFATKISTENRTIAEVVGDILYASQLGGGSL
ncbi:AAA family ATPase [Halobacillus litoralis]|uniref:AAA family ATPase n=1 Tax=Halobacillus litoralis TaxID=45668 RepID=UPI001CD2931E|nr:AAA family ATPase [Halobacillus litoralis]MCA0970238.1 AAA family ATPase [Halobacillus litoralis]